MSNKPERKVICILGDGSFLYGNGFSALWTVAHYNIPILYIIDNNSCFSSTKSVHIDYLKKMKEGDIIDNIIGQDLKDPIIDFSFAPKFFGIQSISVDNPDYLKEALEKGIESLNLGKPFLIDVKTLDTSKFLTSWL
ncbi:MAG: thiamine pyrophosphate-dependent enzyme [Nitrososphaerales archaeon]